MRGSVVCALAALSLLHCKVDDDAGDEPHGVVTAGDGGGAGMGASGGGGSVQAGVDGKGMAGTGGAGMGAAGMAGSGGAGAGAGGMMMMMGAGGAGMAGMTGSGGMSGSGGTSGSGGAAAGGDAETGRMIGMTAAHNKVRAEVDTDPPLPPLTWSAEIAEYAQEWADGLNKNCEGIHRTTHKYGENIASFGTTGGGQVSTAEQAVEGWAGEVACWDYGIFMQTDHCDMSCTDDMMSDGCGHYTQLVWRESVRLGCGVTTCERDGYTWDIWVCNYDPLGNYPAKPY